MPIPVEELLLLGWRQLGRQLVVAGPRLVVQQWLLEPWRSRKLVVKRRLVARVKGEVPGGRTSAPAAASAPGASGRPDTAASASHVHIRSCRHFVGALDLVGRRGRGVTVPVVCCTWSQKIFQIC